MFLLQQILPGAAVALLVAIALSALAWWCKNDLVRAMAAPIAVGVGYVTGHFFVAGWGTFPPTDTTNWLPHIALATAVMAALAIALTSNSVLRTALFLLLSLVALRLLLKPKFQYGW